MKTQANSLQAAGNAALCRTELPLSLNTNISSFSSANIQLFTWGSEKSKGELVKKTTDPNQITGLCFLAIPRDELVPLPDSQTQLSWGWHVFLPFSPFSPFGPRCPCRPGGPIGPGSPEGMRRPSLPLSTSDPQTGTGQGKGHQIRTTFWLRS